MRTRNWLMGCIKVLQAIGWACALCTASGSAAASGASASTSISGITIQLTDLDSGDGVAPTIAFADGIGYTTSARAWNSLTAEFKTVATSSFLETSGGEYTALVSSAKAASTVVGYPLGGAVLLRTSAWAGIDGGADGLALIRGSFELSANTQMTVTANIAASGVFEGGADQVSAQEMFLISGYVDGKYQSSGAGYVDRLSTTATPGVFSFAFESPASFNYANLSSGTVDADLEIWTSSYVTLNPPAPSVPEPANWLLLIIGLALARRLQWLPGNAALRRI